VAGAPLVTVALAEGPPLTVSRKEALAMPVPVRGTRVGELGSELVTVRVPGRLPRAVGVKVTVAVQVAPAAKVLVGQGLVKA